MTRLTLMFKKTKNNVLKRAISTFAWSYKSVVLLLVNIQFVLTDSIKSVMNEWLVTLKQFRLYVFPPRR